jgi:hypothetical protein
MIGRQAGTDTEDRTMAKDTATVTKKKGSAKKGTAAAAGLSVIEGGKGHPVLADGKTHAAETALRRALGVYGVPAKDSEDVHHLLLKVRGHLKPLISEAEKKAKRGEEDGLVKCEVCGEVSTEHTDFCPYCGDEGLPPEDEEQEQPAAATTTSATPAAAAPAAPAKGKKKKGAEAAPEAATAPAVAAVGDALVKAGAELDEKVARVNALRVDLAKNTYDIGIEIREIHERELWKARGHQSFKEFVEKDLEMSRTLAYRLIETTKEYDRATFESVGARKLALVASIQDAEVRDAALEAAKAGATVKEIERTKDKAKGKSAPDKEERATAAPRKTNEITLLAKVNGKPTTHQWRSASSGRPLAAHKDDAYGEVEVSEDVRLRVALKVDKEGKIVGFTTAFVRVE